MNSPKKVSMADIAEKLSISKVAVSFALRGSHSVSKELRDKVLSAAREMGYSKDALVSRVMRSIRSPDGSGFCETIALINANKDKMSLRVHPTLPTYVGGIRAAAAELGYSLDEFWLGDPFLDGDSLSKIFRSRGIRGGILLGLFEGNELPKRFESLWKNFKFVAAGLRTFNPTLDFTSADQFLIAHHATMKIIEHGYARPALVLDAKIDELVEGRFVGGYLRAQMNIREKDRLPPFMKVVEAKKNVGVFYRWFEKYKPDAILCLYNSPKKWLEELGLKIPRDIALVQLERRKNESDWTGMDQHNDIVGEAALKKLVDLLNRPEGSAAPHVTATIVTPQWVEAHTMKSKKGL